MSEIIKSEAGPKRRGRSKSPVPGNRNVQVVAVQTPGADTSGSMQNLSRDREAGMSVTVVYNPFSDLAAQFGFAIVRALPLLGLEIFLRPRSFYTFGNASLDTFVIIFSYYLSQLRFGGYGDYAPPLDYQRCQKILLDSMGLQFEQIDIEKVKNTVGEIFTAYEQPLRKAAKNTDVPYEFDSGAFLTYIKEKDKDGLKRLETLQTFYIYNMGMKNADEFLNAAVSDQAVVEKARIMKVRSGDWRSLKIGAIAVFSQMLANVLYQTNPRFLMETSFAGLVALGVLKLGVGIETVFNRLLMSKVAGGVLDAVGEKEVSAVLSAIGGVMGTGVTVFNIGKEFSTLEVQRRPYVILAYNMPYVMRSLDYLLSSGSRWTALGLRPESVTLITHSFLHLTSAVIYMMYRGTDFDMDQTTIDDEGIRVSHLLLYTNMVTMLQTIAAVRALFSEQPMTQTIQTDGRVASIATVALFLGGPMIENVLLRGVPTTYSPSWRLIGLTFLIEFCDISAKLSLVDDVPVSGEEMKVFLDQYGEMDPSGFAKSGDTYTVGPYKVRYNNTTGFGKTRFDLLPIKSVTYSVYHGMSDPGFLARLYWNSGMFSSKTVIWPVVVALHVIQVGVKKQLDAYPYSSKFGPVLKVVPGLFYDNLEYKVCDFKVVFNKILVYVRGNIIEKGFMQSIRSEHWAVKGSDKCNLQLIDRIDKLDFLKIIGRGGELRVDPNVVRAFVYTYSARNDGYIDRLINLVSLLNKPYVSELLKRLRVLNIRMSRLGTLADIENPSEKDVLRFKNEAARCILKLIVIMSYTEETYRDMLKNFMSLLLSDGLAADTLTSVTPSSITGVKWAEENIDISVQYVYNRDHRAFQLHWLGTLVSMMTFSYMHFLTGGKGDLNLSELAFLKNVTVDNVRQVMTSPAVLQIIDTLNQKSTELPIMAGSGIDFTTALAYDIISSLVTGARSLPTTFAGRVQWGTTFIKGSEREAIQRDPDVPPPFTGESMSPPTLPPSNPWPSPDESYFPSTASSYSMETYELVVVATVVLGTILALDIARNS